MNEGIKVTGEWLFYLDGHLIRREKNLIVQGGLNFLAGLLTGSQAADVPIFLGLGTGTTAPALTNTKLEAEGLRKAVASKTQQNNEVRIRTFFLPVEANGAWKEFGLFLGATEVPNSGTLFNRLVPPGGISKAGNQVLSIEVRVTFTAS